MTAKMQTEDAKAVYKQRKVIVEPVFGHIKNSGFRGFSVRGKDKVAGEFSLVCATHNLKKIARSIARRAGLIRSIHPEQKQHRVNIQIDKKQI